MIPLLGYLAGACISTIVLEAIPILLLKEKKDWFQASVICNVATNPVLNVALILLAFYLGWSRLIYGLLLLMELAVVFLEAWLYRLMLGKPFGKCLIFSACANVFSFGIGLVFDQLTSLL